MLDPSYTPEVRRGIVPFTLAKLVTNSAYRFATPFLATIASGLHITLLTIGTALAIGELGGIAVPLLIGVSHRLSHRRSMSLGLGGVAIAASGCAASQNAAELAGALFVLAGSQAFFNIGASSWLQTRVPFEKRAERSVSLKRRGRAVSSSA